MENQFKGTNEEWVKLRTWGTKTDTESFWIAIGTKRNKTILEAKGVHYGVDNKECLHNAELILEAGNVRQTINCSLTELKKQRDEMLVFLTELYNDFEAHDGLFPSQQIKLKQLIEKSKQS